MRIALDARTIYRPQRRGTGKNLIDLYRALAVVRPDWQVIGYHREVEPAHPLIERGFLQPRYVEMPGDRFDAWQRWRLPLAAWREGADLLHCPANTCPAWSPLPTVVTIHDLIPLDMPGDAGPEQVRRFERGVRNACRRAAWIICPSAFTADRLVREFGADAERLSVIPWAPDSSLAATAPPHATAQTSASRTLEHFTIRRPFVLHFGGRGRKNTHRLLEAWALVDAGLRRRWSLLVVGLDEATREALAAVAVSLNVQTSVNLHGFADESRLPALLRAADVLAYPSLMEGFGLPILDAWVTATPVLAGNNTSIPEVAGDAALLVDALDPCGIARGLTRLLTDRSLRRLLNERGTRRLEQFSWQRTAQQFASVMEAAREAAYGKQAAA